MTRGRSAAPTAATPPASANLADAAYRHIRGKLLSGKLPPGARLVNRSLAKELGTSFIPVREAISRLASEGVVEQIAGAGAFVRKLDRRDIIELHSVRQAMECHAAAEAALRIDDGQMRRLADVCGLWEQLLEQAERGADGVIRGEALAQWIDADLRFHRTIFEAAQNRWLEKVATDARVLAQVFSAKPADLPADVARRTIQLHARLRRAFKRRDAGAAAALMREQIQHGLDFVLRRLGEGQEELQR